MAHQQATSYICSKNKTLFLSQKEAEKGRIRKHLWAPRAQRGEGAVAARGSHIYKDSEDKGEMPHPRTEGRSLKNPGRVVPHRMGRDGKG